MITQLYIKRNNDDDLEAFAPLSSFIHYTCSGCRYSKARLSGDIIKCHLDPTPVDVSSTHFCSRYKTSDLEMETAKLARDLWIKSKEDELENIQVKNNYERRPQ